MISFKSISKSQLSAFIWNGSPQLRAYPRSSLPVLKLYGTKPGDESLGPAKNTDSFVVSYLVDRFGVTPEKAITVSNYVKFETADIPDSVLSFLKIHGFTETQVSRVVQKTPRILSSRPQKTLLPKIEFFKSLGFTVEEYTAVLCRDPTIFMRSLEKQLLPTMDFFKQFLSSPDYLKGLLKRGAWIFSAPTKARMECNIQLLREMEVHESVILRYLRRHPRLFTKDKDDFIQTMEEIKGWGFDPTRKSFLAAVHVMCSMSKSTWDKKIKVYKKWGFSEDQVLDAFVRSPWVMACSEEKILKGMDFCVNKMGLKSSDVLRNPVVLLLSLEKRIIPRHLVYQTLVAEGLLKKDSKLLIRMLLPPEERFLVKFVKSYEDKVPNLQKQYKAAQAMH
ncbi:unnamed protein product [Cuscuta campestris]|uniref:Uncharacterized protein n=1 Tax=Cuscuta campestris TaxID=132261 RepID=A0A484KJY7_9ASTE|nr:unnamed protein product [Cuscuta campestris]